MTDSASVWEFVGSEALPRSGGFSASMCKNLTHMLHTLAVHVTINSPLPAEFPHASMVLNTRKKQPVVAECLSSEGGPTHIPPGWKERLQVQVQEVSVVPT